MRDSLGRHPRVQYPVIAEFATLAEALRASFPPDSCRLLAVREHGDVAVALFDTRPSAEPYLYEVYYYRTNGRWSEGSSGNGPGWHRLDSNSDIGVATSGRKHHQEPTEFEQNSMDRLLTKRY
jgi:hypothetical protein